ncbi:MAG: DUF1800 domain-containing protein [Saprospiraceae bacterium]|nr:DUF1800 domain-containing protein [Saprospiraceae bacterium]
MDRRATLARLVGHSRSDKAVKTVSSLDILSGLTPYTGPFGYEQAAHLLRRASFGASYQQIKEAVNDGLDDTMSKLMTLPNDPPSPPVNYYFTEDVNTPIGETWVDKLYSGAVQGLRASREQSLRAWTLNLMHTEGTSIREKMVLFWHNHFPVADQPDTRVFYSYSQLLRSHAIGNFRDLTKAMTIEPAMLRYLNGDDNTANSPNENYAREVLELFTIGKGLLAGPNDYTNYTEQDVVEMAKVFSGWRSRVVLNSPPNAQTIEAFFTATRHNQTTKQLSHRFDDLQIPNLGDQEYAFLIDKIFEKDECAKFICRKLYRWFVYYEIPQQVEEEVIAPMAQILLDNNYEIKPALEALLKSEHFFDILNVGPMIKSPIDFVIGLFKMFEIDMAPANLSQYYAVFSQAFTRTSQMQMPYYDPPSVAGWKAYYQEPVFYRHWISSVTLPFRQNYTNRMLNAGLTINDDNNNVLFAAKIDVLKFVATLDNPTTADALIDECVKILFPQPITTLQHGYLKGLLLPNGQADTVWSTQYSNYLSDPSNTAAATPVRNKLTALLRGMMYMPEYYLS